MNILDAIKERHSVRSFTDQPIAAEAVAALQQAVDECNRESGLNIQLIIDEPKAFGTSKMAHYGKFSGVRNYLAMVGKKDFPDLDGRVGYYGERLVLLAQQLGLNSCWVGLTYKKQADVVQIGDDERLRCVIALGYGTTQGVAHKVKDVGKVCRSRTGEMPDWFCRGLAAAMLAPTALNQQKFRLTLLPGNQVEAKARMGYFSKVDLGIVKYHFEQGAGTENFTWKE